MSTHASAGRRWQPAELDALTVEDGFRLRGLEVTRLDTFVDAAFAFVLTLLVISFEEIPASYGELVDAMKRVPAFIASFALLMLFWLTHRQWSRRYGLETGRTLTLSLTLILVMLIYVYPLRTMIESAFASLSGGWLPSEFVVGSITELRGLFALYAVGFVVLSLLLRSLHGAALGAHEPLGLDPFEIGWTRVSVRIWTVCASVGASSLLCALVLPDAIVAIAGFVYWLLGPAIGLVVWQGQRTHPRPDRDGPQP